MAKQLEDRALASLAKSFGFRSFEVKGSLVAGEFQGGGSVLLAIRSERDRLVITVSMVAGPPGTLAKIEMGAVRVALALIMRWLLN